MESRVLIKSIIGGFLIGVGGTCFLSLDNKTVGAFMFSLGLLAICVTGQNLYTGKVCYLDSVPTLATIFVGNYIGATLMGWFVRYTRPNLVAKAVEMRDAKLGEGMLVILLGIACNILIYFAVEGFNKGHTLMLVMCVMAFILCGFEHSVANMFYFAVSYGVRGLKNIPANYFLFMNAIGNTIGGIIVQCIHSSSREGCQT